MENFIGKKEKYIKVSSKVTNEKVTELSLGKMEGCMKVSGTMANSTEMAYLLKMMEQKEKEFGKTVEI